MPALYMAGPVWGSSTERNINPWYVPRWDMLGPLLASETTCLDADGDTVLDPLTPPGITTLVADLGHTVVFTLALTQEFVDWLGPWQMTTVDSPAPYFGLTPNALRANAEEIYLDRWAEYGLTSEEDAVLNLLEMKYLSDNEYAVKEHYVSLVSTSSAAPLPQLYTNPDGSTNYANMQLATAARLHKAWDAVCMYRVATGEW